MKSTSFRMGALNLFVILLLTLPLQSVAQGGGDDPQQKKLSKEELAQLVAPIALYPDDLVVQILMASTYPLEIVQADRWVRQHKELKGDAMAKALEKESWDPSVKSLVNFPSVLAAMSEKLDVTSKLGDAFLAQQKDVMATIQELRRKAYDAGNLKSAKEQKVVVEKETIVIQPASPEVVYVPSYSPTVVYGAWAYPAYPPYYYYPPPPPAYPPYYFAAGVAVGVAWGYAWGNCNWHGGSVNYNVNQNININNNINRNNYVKPSDGRPGQGGQGTWQHDPSHRQGVAYKDKATAQKYGQSPARSAEGRREARGFGDGRGGPSGQDRGGTGAKGGADRGAAARGARDSAFGGGFGSGGAERMASERGSASRASAGGMSSRSGGFGGGARSGEGFGGGGGRRR